MRLHLPLTFSAAMIFTAACGSTGGQVKGNTSGSGSAHASSSGGGGGGGYSDDDFRRRDVEEVAAPVYLVGIDEEAQDFFREGIQAVSGRTPDYKKAEEKFRDAAKKAPDFLEAYFNWGQALERQGKDDAAIAVYQNALDNNPGDPSAPSYIAKIYLGKARAADLLGEKQEFEALMAQAKGYLDASSAMDPTNVATNNALALYYLMREDVDTAERYVKEVLYVEPTNVTGLNTRGLINLKQNRLRLAEWIFQEKLLNEQHGLDPSSPEALTNLGYTLIQLEQRQLAMQYFQAALDLDPNNMAARENIAAMLLEHLDYAQALDHYERILERQPLNIEAQIGRCDSIYGLGGVAEDKKAQFSEAISCYENHLKERPDRTDLYKRIADTYQLKLQDLDNAVLYYERYGKEAKLSAADAEANEKLITGLKSIIASGGFDAFEPSFDEGDDFDFDDDDGELEPI